jgi:hypothetical protein
MHASVLSRRALISTRLAVGAAAAFAPAFAQAQMTAVKMQALIDYTLRRNKEDGKSPIRLGQIRPILFPSINDVQMLQIGNDEGAIKERFSVTVNLSQQHVILFSRGEDAVYFHLTGVHLRRESSAINRREGGPSRWNTPEAAKDFARQMSYWAGRSTK